MSNNMTPMEAAKLEIYLREKLNPQLDVKLRHRPDECAELYMGAECLGVVAKIIDEGETSYSVEISIIQEDLDDA